MCRPTTPLGRGQANMEDLTIIIPQVKFPTCMGEDSLFKFPKFPSQHQSQSQAVVQSLLCKARSNHISMHGANISSQIPPYVPGEHIRCIFAIYYYYFLNQQSHGVVCD